MDDKAGAHKGLLGRRALWLAAAGLLCAAAVGLWQVVRMRPGRLAFVAETGSLQGLRDPGLKALFPTEWSVFVCRGDGTEPRRLTRGLLCSRPRWSPNGSKLAFDALDPRTERRGVWTIPSRGGKPTLVSGGLPNAGHAAWSPDGRTLAFTSGGDDVYRVWVVAGDGGDARLVYEDDWGDRPSHAQKDQTPQWSPDGRRIALIVGRGDAEELCMVKLNASQPTYDHVFSSTVPEVVLPDSGRPGESLIAPAALGSVEGPVDWSPDGKLLLFSARALGSTRRFLYTVSAEGGQPRWLPTRDGAGFRDAKWSPDGTRIAYVAEHALDSRNEVRVVDHEGRELETVAEMDGLCRRITWSSDGAMVAFTCQKGRQKMELWVIGLGAHGEFALVNSALQGANCSEPDWSPR